MNIIKKYINFDTLIILLANVFADITILPFLIAIITLSFKSTDENTKYGDLVFVILLLLMILIKFIILPAIYNFLGKNSKNKLILNFIKKLKYSKKTKIFILIITGFIFLIPTTAIAILSFKDIKYKVFIYYIYFFITSLFSSYLVLFAYWDFVEKRKLR